MPAAAAASPPLLLSAAATAAEWRAAPLPALVALYDACTRAYYHTDAPLLSDARFDALEEVLRERAPDHPALAAVGARRGGDDGDDDHDEGGGGGGARACALPRWMGSQDKIYAGDHRGFAAWGRRPRPGRSSRSRRWRRR